MVKNLALVLCLLLAACAPAAKTYTAQAVIDEFKLAGLEAEDAKAMTKDDYGLAPMRASKAIRFLIPSLCSDCGGRVFEFADGDNQGLEQTKTYYEELGKNSAAFYSWVFVSSNILVQINGELPETQALKYQAVLDEATQ